MTINYVYALDTKWGSALFDFAAAQVPEKIAIRAPTCSTAGEREVSIHVAEGYVLTVSLTEHYSGKSEWGPFTPSWVSGAARRLLHPTNTKVSTRDVMTISFSITPVEQAVHTVGGTFDKRRGGGERWIVHHFPSDAVPTKEALESGEWDKKMEEKKEKENAIAEQRQWFESRNVLIWFYRQMGDGASLIRYDFYKKGVRHRVPGVLEDERITCAHTSSPSIDQEEKILSLVRTAIQTGELDEDFLKDMVFLYESSTRAVILKRMEIIPSVFA